jgi:hypothetical protein
LGHRLSGVVPGKLRWLMNEEDRLKRLAQLAVEVGGIEKGGARVPILRNDAFQIS